MLQAGGHQLMLLELESDLLKQGARETGYDCEVTEGDRMVTLDLESTGEEPLLLFNASDPGNSGWFSRCQFYADGYTGAVLQTPFLIAHKRSGGRIQKRALRLQIRKELPLHFRLPGRQPVNEKVLYSVLFNFLNALRNTGVGVCAGPLLSPLADKNDAPPSPPFTRS